VAEEPVWSETVSVGPISLFIRELTGIEGFPHLRGADSIHIINTLQLNSLSVEQGIFGGRSGNYHSDQGSASKTRAER